MILAYLNIPLLLDLQPTLDIRSMLEFDFTSNVISSAILRFQSPTYVLEQKGLDKSLRPTFLLQSHRNVVRGIAS